jgi:spore coat protein H
MRWGVFFIGVVCSLSLWAGTSVVVPQLKIGGVNVPYDQTGKRFFLSVDAKLGVDRAKIEYLPSSGQLALQSVTYASGDKVDFKAASGNEKTFIWQDGDTRETYKLIFTELPIVEITAAVIGDERNDGLIRITSAQPSLTTSDLKMGIKVRGASSRLHPKKPYSVELKSEMSLLELRKSTDWILDASYKDKSLVRNRVSHAVYQMMQPRGPGGVAQNVVKGSPVEVILNGDYVGAYQLTERVDGDLLHLDKKSLLYKAIDYDANFSKTSPVSSTKEKATWHDGFELSHPKKGSLKPLEDFVQFVAESSDKEFSKEIESCLDIDSAVDFWIFVLLVGGSDNITKNYYLARAGSKGGDKFFFTPWDLDGTWGYEWRGIKTPATDWWPVENNRLFERLYLSKSLGFAKKVSTRWKALRSGKLSEKQLESLFAERLEPLRRSGACARNLSRWGLWDGAKDLSTVLDEDYRRDWIADRIKFLDKEF